MAAHETVEAQILLAMARPVLGEAEKAWARDLIAQHGDRLDWGFLLDHAGRHKILALVAKHLETLWPDSIRLPHRALLERYRIANRLRNAMIFTELETVLPRLAAAGIHPVLRKGAVTAQHLYRDISAREIGDVDLLVGRDDIDRAREDLGTLGYVEGEPARSGRTVVAISRKARLYASVYGIAAQFYRPASEPLVKLYAVELAHNLFLPGTGFSATIADLRDECEPCSINGVPAVRLGPPALLLDLCADIHAKARTLYWVRQRRHVQLSKLADLCGLAQTATPDLARQTHALADRLGVVRPIAFSLHLAASVLGPDPFRTLLEHFPIDPQELMRYGEADGIVGAWDLSPVERVFDLAHVTEAPPSAYVEAMRSAARPDDPPHRS